ncbi:MAG TPA: extracellular solute-binding protein [Gemmataceae bacterium]|nr:extracellular solute-binding protein [Gemmataceae bacterium]
MQQIYLACHRKSRRIVFSCGIAIFAILTGFGCTERPTTIDPPPVRPYAGVSLKVAAADPADRELLRQLGRSWAVRNGVDLQILDDPRDGAADVQLIPMADLPQLANAGALAELPTAFKSPTDAYRWDDILQPYAARLTNWRDRTYALPVIGEGLVLAFRNDIFDGKDGRPLPPTTWEELRDAGNVYGLPPVPAGAERLQTEFFAAAACYDRPAVGRNAGVDVLREREAFFTFQIDMKSGDPRLDTPAFVHVANLFAGMKKRSKLLDAAAAFRAGETNVGILSLAELGRVGPEIADKLGIAALPGSRFTFDAKGEQMPTVRDAVNRVPYLGYAGRVGVVSARCTAPEAAWNFLVDAGLPERNALDLIADARWGAGAYRSSQLDGKSRSRWYVYGLSASETERLTNALRDNLGLGTQNYRIRLRTPNHNELDAALDADLRATLTGKEPVEAGMKKANADWTSIIDRQPRQSWIDIARRSSGF